MNKEELQFLLEENIDEEIIVKKLDFKMNFGTIEVLIDVTLN